MTSFFRFVNKREIYRLGIISLAHAPVHTFKPGKPCEVGKILALYRLKSLSLEYKVKLKSPCFFLQVALFFNSIQFKVLFNVDVKHILQIIFVLGLVSPGSYWIYTNVILTVVYCLYHSQHYLIWIFSPENRYIY
jgi:hypothetical protein